MSEPYFYLLLFLCLCRRGLAKVKKGNKVLGKRALQTMAFSKSNGSKNYK
jgi:hypothetical protein